MTAIVLAAGESKRMGGGTPKVLRLLGNRPLLAHVIDSCRAAGATRIIVVVGAAQDTIRARFANQGLEFAVQSEPKGTADAVLACRDVVRPEEECVVVYGDVPLMTGSSICRLIETRRQTQADVAVLTAVLDNPCGYGRVVRGAGGTIERIVEERDADEVTRRVREVNSGFYAFVWGRIRPALERVRPSPVSGEYYLTDAIALVRADGGKVVAVPMDDPCEMLGANTPEQLTAIERIWAARLAAAR
ncbi:MAG: NTP transferase domain-containing protein [candidate division WOR-3 bacterium]